MKKRIFIIIVFVLAFLALLLIFSPYIKAEILTLKYGQQFANKYNQTNMIDDIQYMKVIEYSDTYAEVFYVTDNHETGELMIFEKENEGWVYVYWNTVWSKTGSADNFMWPYYR